MIKIHLDTQHLDLDDELEDYLESRIKDIWFAYSGRQDKANINYCGIEFTFQSWLEAEDTEKGYGRTDRLIGDMDALQDEINKPDWEGKTLGELEKQSIENYLNSYEP